MEMNRDSCREADGRSSAQLGFTLLEFLIAFALLALMAAAMFGSFRVAVNSYEKSQTRMDAKARERALEDLIRRQVGSLFPMRATGGFMLTEEDPTELSPELQVNSAQALMGQAPLFNGTNQSMTFVTVAPLRLIQNPGLTVVRYGLAEDEWGRPYLGAMETRFSGLGSFQQMVEIPAGKPIPLVEGVEEVAFEYYGYLAELQIYQWFEEWYGDQMMAVPLAVRITAGDRIFVVAINATSFGRGRAANIRNARARALQALPQEEDRQ
jgi:type II secretory pathway pseudopilin PulG